jgi:hypothetical protein
MLGPFMVQRRKSFQTIRRQNRWWERGRQSLLGAFGFYDEIASNIITNQKDEARNMGMHWI